MAKVTIIITEAPYGTENAFGILAAAGALATIHNITVIFAEAGVFNAIKTQDTSGFIEYQKKSYDLPSNESKIIDFQDIGIQFFVDTLALELRSVKNEDLIQNIQKLSIDQISDEILKSDQILII